MRKTRAITFWRVLNPLMRPLAGLAPWWVLVETVGRKSGATRRTPLAVGRKDADGLWVIAVHGRHAGWVLNAEAAGRVRYRHMLRWVEATPVIHDWRPEAVARMSAYARSGLRLSAQDPLLVELRPPQVPGSSAGDESRSRRAAW